MGERTERRQRERTERNDKTISAQDLNRKHEEQKRTRGDQAIKVKI